MAITLPSANFSSTQAVSMLNSQDNTYIGLMHTLFTLEDRYGLKVCECEGEAHLRVNVHQGSSAFELSGWWTH